MKKLIISIVATASLALVAKADVAPLNATSFEEEVYNNAGFSVGQREDGQSAYWAGGSDASYEWKTLATGDKAVTRPKYWASKTDVADTRALAIDTEDALVRYVKPVGTSAEDQAQAIGETGLYFDSMVQFTAAEDAPVVTPGDKLIVWLKEIPGEGESATSTYKLCVTAANLDGESKPIPDVFETDAVIAPDSWHRLSIAANIVKHGEASVTQFKVYVDAEGSDAEPVATVYSLVARDASTYNPAAITSVSFKGKGVIDDIVLTTEDPYYVAPVEPETISLTWSGTENIEGFSFVWASPEASMLDALANQNKSAISAKIGETVRIACSLPEGYTAKCGEKSFTSGVAFTVFNCYYDVEITDETPDTLEFTVVAPAEPEVAKPFTVTIGENEEKQFETLAGAIAAAGGETIKLNQAATLTEKLTVAEDAVIDLNGQTLTLAETADWAVVVKAALKITDSSSEKSGKVIVPGYYGFGVGSWVNNIDVAGVLTIEAGTFEADVADYLIGAYIGTVNISGGVLDSCYNVLNAFGKNADGSRVTVNISGGTFSVGETDCTGEYASEVLMTAESVKWAVSGGFFSMPLDEAFCAEGKVPTTEADDNGYYTVVDKADEKPTAGENELEAKDFDNPETVNSTTEVTLPDGWKVSEDMTQILNKDNQPFVTFPSYYTATVVDGVIKLALNDTVKPVIAESKEGETTVKPMEFAKEGEKDVVKLNVPGRNAKLFYGVKAAGTLTGLDGATPAWATDRGANPPAVTKSGNAQFFRVVVTDVLPAQD